eukprot:6201947-Pleurochrysis_carterae.AAC.1
MEDLVAWLCLDARAPRVGRIGAWALRAGARGGTAACALSAQGRGAVAHKGGAARGAAQNEKHARFGRESPRLAREDDRGRRVPPRMHSQCSYFKPVICFEVFTEIASEN